MVTTEIEMLTISIAKDFSRFPGPRYEIQGKSSGQLFLKELLRPKYIKALSENSKLLIDLDGTEGYSSAFLDGSFGELAREFGKEKVLQTLQFISIDEPYLKDEIEFYMTPSKK